MTLEETMELTRALMEAIPDGTQLEDLGCALSYIVASTLADRSDETADEFFARLEHTARTARMRLMLADALEAGDAE